MNYSNNELIIWKENINYDEGYSINPKTNRKIKKTGRLYKKIENQYMQMMDLNNDIYNSIFTKNKYNGNKYQEFIIYKYGFLKEYIKNHQWDCYGININNEKINIQIKLKCINNTKNDLPLGSLENYFTIDKDFILILGEYKGKFTDIDINEIDTKCYYIKINEWKKHFKLDINQIKNLHQTKTDIDIENDINIKDYRNKYYISYGNKDKNNYTKLNFQIVKSINGRNNELRRWMVSIKGSKFKDFLMLFNEINIIDYSYVYNNELILFNNINI